MAIINLDDDVMQKHDWETCPARESAEGGEEITTKKNNDIEEGSWIAKRSVHPFRLRELFVNAWKFRKSVRVERTPAICAQSIIFQIFFLQKNKKQYLCELFGEF